MRRREFFAASLSTAAGVLTMVRMANAGPLRTVGVLMSFQATDGEGRLQVGDFRKALEGAGWREGENLKLAIEWGVGDPARAPQLASQLMVARPEVVLAVSPAALDALRPAAGATPIVFVAVPAPIAERLATNFAHPGGSITGFTQADPSIAGKDLAFFQQLVPSVAELGLLLDPSNAASNAAFLPALGAAAQALGLRLTQLPAASDAEISAAVADFGRARNRGIFLVPSALFVTHREAIISAAARARLPAVYWDRRFADAGGLIAYGIDDRDIVVLAARYVARILKGEKAGDLPIQSPTKFELSINLKTAKSLGIAVPQSLLAQADQVIE